MVRGVGANQLFQVSPNLKLLLVQSVKLNQGRVVHGPHVVGADCQLVPGKLEAFGLLALELVEAPCVKAARERVGLRVLVVCVPVDAKTGGLPLVGREHTPETVRRA